MIQPSNETNTIQIRKERECIISKILYLVTGAAGCIAAADKGRKGECYILGNEEVTLKEMCGLLDKDLHCGTCKFYLPLGLAKLLARQMEKKAAKTGKKALMTTFSVYNLERNNAFDYSKAKKELGYHTRSYAETLHDEAVWLRQEGKIA